MEILKTIIRQLGIVLSVIISYIRKMYEQDRNNRIAQQQMNLQQSLEHSVWNHMRNIQRELFEVFQHNHYPKLIQIKIPDDIRIDGYKFDENIQNWIYFFTIDKTDFEEIAWVVCKSIKQKMDMDMFSFKKKLGCSQPEIQMMYPNMMNGIRVVNLENRMDCVRITVVTAIKPCPKP